MWGLKVVRSEMIIFWLKDTLKCCIFTCGGQSNNGKTKTWLMQVIIGAAQLGYFLIDV